MIFPFLRETDVQTNAVIRTISEKFTGGILAATPYLWVLALPLLPAFRHCLHRRRVTACVVYGSLAAMVVMTVVDCEMAGVLYRYLMDYSPVLLLGAALCWFCAEGALSRRAALGGGHRRRGTARAAHRHGRRRGVHRRLPLLHALCHGALAAGHESFPLLHRQPPCSILDVKSARRSCYYG